MADKKWNIRQIKEELNKRQILWTGVTLKRGLMNLLLDDVNSGGPPLDRAPASVTTPMQIIDATPRETSSDDAPTAVNESPPVAGVSSRDLNTPSGFMQYFVELERIRLERLREKHRLTRYFGSITLLVVFVSVIFIFLFSQNNNNQCNKANLLN